MADLRKKLADELERVGLDREYAETDDQLPGIAVLIRNRRRNGLDVGTLPLALQQLANARGVKLPPHFP